jgi:hypothetical protein
VALQWRYRDVHVGQEENEVEREQLCYSGDTVVLQWCYSGVTVASQWCYRDVHVGQEENEVERENADEIRKHHHQPRAWKESRPSQIKIDQNQWYGNSSDSDDHNDGSDNDIGDGDDVDVAGSLVP